MVLKTEPVKEPKKKLIPSLTQFLANFSRFFIGFHDFDQTDSQSGS